MQSTPKRILLAESNTIDRDILSHRLKIIDYDVCAVSTGKELLEKIENEQYDIILIDISLSDVTNIELIQKIKATEELCNTPILTVIKSSQMESATISLQNGANDYILKPFNLELVRKRIQIWIDNKSSITYDKKTIHILIVDDNEMNRDMLTRRLKKLGFKTEVAIDGIDAINKVKSYNYNLMLLDIMMPNLDGFEVLEKLKCSDKPDPIPIIMLTALNDNENIIKATKLGAADYLVKPFNIDQVKQRIHACLSKYG